jgi:DNA-binding transcriptional MerR regulator
MSANGRKTYTVKQVAKLSRVSDRTLRFYDQIGLLKPAYYGENGYRYYEKEQLLGLQQILFYRELGFELSKIQKVMGDPKFDKVAALKSHREQLAREIERTKALIMTIDKTLAHLEREIPMQDNDMYVGFDPKKMAEYEKWSREKFGDVITERWKKAVEDSKEMTKTWKKEDFEKVRREYDELHQAFADLLKSGIASDSAEVQALAKRHYAAVSRFWSPKRNSYISLGKVYCEHPDYRKMYDSNHPRLAEYLAEAMRIYAIRQLEPGDSISRTD